MCNIYKYVQRILLFSFLLIGNQAISQNFFASVFAGSSNYSGELQEKRFSFSQSNLAFGIGLLFEANEKLLIRGDFTYGRISASDEFSSKNKNRNLSFYSYVYEYSLGAEYVLLDLYRYRVSPYLMTGIALYDFNPFTKDKDGNKIMLSELSTEGQGFFDGRKDYKLRQYSIPIGGGIQWAINDNKRIGIVLGFRKTFTDYLDDVSTTYVDELVLAANRGQKAANIAYRGDEVPGGSSTYPAGGTQRGNPKTKDWYYFTGITFRIRLTPKKREIEFRFDTKKSRKSRLGCPKLY
ncbi:MAG: hypothetical protein KBF74_00755 [Ferruginibacter sp.]|nr:hypothetical protein [Ferruginibacter sp.]